MSAVLASPRSGVVETLDLIDGLPIDAYHSGPGISKSGLDDIARSPATYFARHLDPNRPPARDRAGQLEGTLAHCAVLEPDEFSERYVSIPPGAPRRPTDAQWNAKKPSEDSVASMAWWREFNDRCSGKTIITDEQRRVALAQAESMRRIPDFAQALAGDSVAERSAYARDEATGVLMRCRPDLAYRVERGVVLFDVKTYSSAEPDEFARQVARKRYHAQAAFYTDVYSQASGLEVLGFVFIAVETEYPFLSHALMLDEESLDAGRRAYRRNLEVFAECQARDVWPGYGDQISLITLPRWITRKDEVA